VKSKLCGREGFLIAAYFAPPLFIDKSNTVLSHLFRWVNQGKRGGSQGLLYSEGWQYGCNSEWVTRSFQIYRWYHLLRYKARGLFYNGECGVHCGK